MAVAARSPSAARRRRWPSPRVMLLTGLGLLAVLVGAALLSGGEEKTTRHSGVSFSFEYPADWGQIRNAELPNDKGFLGRSNFGLGRHDYVGVDALDTEGKPIDAGNVSELIPAWNEFHEQFAAENGGRLTKQGRVTEVAGLPTIEHEAELVSPSGVGVIEHVFRVFDRNEGWVISCRKRQDAQAAVKREIDRGCAGVVDSLKPRRGQ